jgi:hypothetical protein
MLSLIEIKNAEQCVDACQNSGTKNIFMINDKIMFIRCRGTNSKCDRHYIPYFLSPYGKQKKYVMNKTTIIRKVISDYDDCRKFLDKNSDHEILKTYCERIDYGVPFTICDNICVSASSDMNSIDNSTMIVNNLNNLIIIISGTYGSVYQSGRSGCYRYDLCVKKYTIKNDMIEYDDEYKIDLQDGDGQLGIQSCAFLNSNNQTFMLINCNNRTLIYNLYKKESTQIDYEIDFYNKKIRDDYYVCQNYCEYGLFSTQTMNVMTNFKINKIKNTDGNNKYHFQTYNDVIIYGEKVYIVSDSEIPIEDQCIVCFEQANKSKVINPCGHVKFCDKCLIEMEKDKKCYICRTEIQSIIKIYM